MVGDGIGGNKTVIVAVRAKVDAVAKLHIRVV